MKPSRIAFEHHWVKTRGKRARNDLKRHPLQPDTYVNDSANRHWVTWQAAMSCHDDDTLKMLGFDVVIDNSLPENTFKLVKGNPYLKFVNFSGKTK